MFSKHVVICFIIFVVISVVVAFDGITFPRLRQTLSPLNPSNRESTKSLADLSRSSEEFALEFLQVKRKLFLVLPYFSTLHAFC